MYEESEDFRITNVFTTNPRVFLFQTKSILCKRTSVDFSLVLTVCQFLQKMKEFVLKFDSYQVTH